MSNTTRKPTRSIEVFRSDENAKQLYIHIYTKEYSGQKESLIRLHQESHTLESQLIRSIQRIGLPPGGKVNKTEWGKITTDDGVSILVIRITADTEFITNQKGTALRLNALVWHPVSRWLTTVCKNSTDPVDGTVLTRHYN